MTSTDIPAGMRLKDLAGWNQTEEDWRRFLRSSPEGCFVAEWDGQAVGTVTNIVYGDRFAWIGMVLVDPDFRGRGIGTALLVRAIEYLDSRRIPCMKLDATPQGRPIYESLGFLAEYEIERCALDREAGAPVHAPSNGGPAEIENILKFDREVFGADRGLLLESLALEAPEFVLAVRNGSVLTGYALGRKGSRADHMGPWAASDPDAAATILNEFLQYSRRDSIFLDVLKDNSWAPEMAAHRGFRSSRNLTRMYRGVNAYPGRPDLLGAILGPEFG